MVDSLKSWGRWFESSSGRFFIIMKEQIYLINLHNLLKTSLLNLGKENLALAFSGGIDSSLLAKIMKNLGINFTAYVTGLKDSHDLIHAEKSAKELKINLKKIIINKKEFEPAINQELSILQNLYEKEKDENLKPTPLRLSYNLPLFFLAKNIKEKFIILGQGPDEMFGGYEKHIKLKKDEAKQEMENNLKVLLSSGIKQNQATFSFFSKKALFPYLTKEVIEFAENLPHELKINNNTGKYILRKLSLNLGLSKELTFKQKKAMQYGTDTRKMLVKIAKQHGLIVDKLIKRILKI